MAGGAASSPAVFRSVFILVAPDKYPWVIRLEIVNHERDAGDCEPRKR